MTLNVGQDFKKRWLNAPEAVRETLLDDLGRICDLLKPATDIQQWLNHDQRAMQVAQLSVEQAYADLKTELIEAARLRKQLALEQALLEKRAAQHAYAEQLQQDERQQFENQTLALHALRQTIDQESIAYSARYQPNPIATVTTTMTQSTSTEFENIRLRLELEAESLIEQSAQVFKEKLLTAMQEEIQFIMTKIESLPKNE